MQVSEVTIGAAAGTFLHPQFPNAVMLSFLPKFFLLSSLLFLFLVYMYVLGLIGFFAFFFFFFFSGSLECCFFFFAFFPQTVSIHALHTHKNLQFGELGG